MEAMEIDNGVAPQKIQCWGRSAVGELGIDGDEEEKIVWKPKSMCLSSDGRDVVKVKEIACGAQHTVFLLENGLVYSTGSNESKQLGHSKNGTKPVKLTMLETHCIMQVSCGEDFTIVLNSENQLYSFGGNKNGQLGYESQQAARPRLIQTFNNKSTKIVQIACGSSHCIALASNGKTYSWGNNENGQLGRELKGSSSHTPSEIASLYSVPIYMVAAGGGHSFALTVSGTLFGWGSNRFGQLGLGDENDRKVPTLVKSLQSKCVSYVCCGEKHTAVLTKSGSVFTFGCGIKGQLGHGSPEKEARPKQVIELAGDKISQIACGRWHTLALVQSSGKVYSFGLNKYGQLGSGEKIKQSVAPNLVQGSWDGRNDERQSGTANRYTEGDLSGFRVSRIFSGGNQNFVLLEDGRTNILPVDQCQKYLIERSTLFLDETKVDKLILECSDDAGKEKRKLALDTITTVFSSPSCLNGSFLNPETHETTGISNHGLDTRSTNDEETDFMIRRVMLKLARNKQIKEKIDLCALTLLKGLPREPPDLEGFRVFLIVPEIAALVRSENYHRYIAEFGKQVLEMRPEVQRRLCRWWSLLPASMFSKIVTLFKGCIKDAMRHFNSGLGQNEEKWRNAEIALFVLQMLNAVNDESNFIIPFEAFYTQIVQQKIDLSLDYRILKFKPGSFCFCQFPFIFDVQGKAKILETDAALKMATAIEKTVQENIHHHLLPVLGNPFLVFHVRRGSYLVQDTLRQIENVQQSPFGLRSAEEVHMEFLKPLKIVFEGEDGVDLGGPKKEFFLLLIEEIFDKKYGMFREIESSQSVWFNSQSFEEPHMYYLIGVIFGLALYNSVIIDVHFPPVLYKKLLNQKPNFADFQSFDPDFARGLRELLDYEEINEGDVENMIVSNFEIEEKVFGETKFFNLVEDGHAKPVNAQNRQQYVDLVVDYYLNKSVSNQYEEFSKGFYEVCESGILSVLRPIELKEMISGCEDYDDFMLIREVAVYEYDYKFDHPVIISFWNVLNNFDIEMKKKFLGFLTGSDKIPIHGIKSIKITIRPLHGEDEQRMLMVAQTCFNILYLPRYRNEEIMTERITFALNNFSKGFGLE